MLVFFSSDHMLVVFFTLTRFQMNHVFKLGSVHVSLKRTFTNLEGEKCKQLFL